MSERSFGGRLSIVLESDLADLKALSGCGQDAINDSDGFDTTPYPPFDTCELLEMSINLWQKGRCAVLRLSCLNQFAAMAEETQQKAKTAVNYANAKGKANLAHNLHVDRSICWSTSLSARLVSNASHCLPPPLHFLATQLATN